jgi:hypothetical protein
MKWKWNENNEWLLWAVSMATIISLMLLNFMQ